MSRARPSPYRAGYSSVAFRITAATGLSSPAWTSRPRRRASNGMLPPPAKGSRTTGRSVPQVARSFWCSSARREGGGLYVKARA